MENLSGTLVSKVMYNINALFGVDIKIAVLTEELEETEDPHILEYLEQRIKDLEPHKHQHIRPFNGSPTG